MSSRTPETLTAAQRAQRLNLQGSETPAANMQKQEKLLSQARKTLPTIGQGAGQRNATADVVPGRDADMSFAVLPIDQIEPYEHNPRTGMNPRYEEIKASIASDGITNMLTVTRRDGAGTYTTYGGGNTRLRIAKELYAAGDKRFATLQVVVKQWPGDAQVITAHLVENENRGDITFWEKAQGVQRFRAEFEKESGKPLTAGELHKELRQRGLNYGMKVLQNFAFSVEHLAPVGPWLMATDVNTLTRPAVAELLELATKFGQAAQFKSVMTNVLEQHKLALQRQTDSNEQLDPSERQAVTLDSAILIEDLQAALAKELGVDVIQLVAMSRALASNTRMTAQELRSLPVAPAAAQVLTAAQPTAPSAPIAPSAPVAERAVLQPTQAPLGAMLSSIPRTPPPAQQPAGLVTASVEDLLGSIRKLLEELNSVVPLYDVLLESPAMPFGYMTDLPVDIVQVGGTPVQQPELRTAIWKVLTALSGQCDERFRDLIPDSDRSDIAWEMAVAKGRHEFSLACRTRANTFTNDDGRPLLGMHELAMVLSDPSVGDTMLQLITKMEQVRLNHPERVFDGCVPLFNGPHTEQR